MGDATETSSSRCCFWQSVYIFGTYKGVSARPIDDRPEPMPSPLNYPAYFWRLPYNCLNNRQDNNKCWLMRLLTTTFGLKTRQNNASRVSRRSFKGANSLWMRKWFPAPVQNIFNICLPVLTVYRHYQIFHHVSGIQ